MAEHINHWVCTRTKAGHGAKVMIHEGLVSTAVPACFVIEALCEVLALLFCNLRYHMP